MKILVGLFNAECNANIFCQNGLSKFDLAFDDLVVSKLYIADEIKAAGVSVIPAIYANAGACGIIEKDAFEAIENSFVTTAKKYLETLDGIYLHLHGASYVQELGSGDHHLLKKLREVVGPYLPIAISCDPHGNLTQEYVNSTQILRSFRQSPHTDNVDTYRKVFRMLCDLVIERQNIHAVYRKLPLILGGEQSVSADEPVKSINQFMDELETDPAIRSVSWHVGYLRHDCPEAGCGIVVVPKSQADQLAAEEVADKLADFIWQRRHEFHYTGLTANPDEALKLALNFDKKPVVITDSGDNMTSGATGWNTHILRQFLALPNLKKSVLFAPLVDENAYNLIKEHAVGDTITLNLGTNRDELSKSVNLTVRIKQFGKISKFTQDVYEKELCDCVVIEMIKPKIDLIIANSSYGIINRYQLEYLGLDWKKYDITVLKQGYIFPDFKLEAQFYVMSLTKGATLQDTKNIQFKRIMRPMYPIDEI